MIWLSDYVPYTKEIVSNNTSAIVRTVKIGYKNYVIRKAPISIL